MKGTQIFDLVREYLPTLIQLAEGLFKWKKKSGVEKKTYVMDTLRVVTTSIAAESTGGQAETWAKISPSIDMALEGLVGVAVATGAFTEPVKADENAAISMG